MTENSGHRVFDELFIGGSWRKRNSYRRGHRIGSDGREWIEWFLHAYRDEADNVFDQSGPARLQEVQPDRCDFASQSELDPERVADSWGCERECDGECRGR